VFTGEIVTTDTGLSEGIFWDYQEKKFPKNFSGIMALRRRCWQHQSLYFCAGKFEKGNCTLNLASSGKNLVSGRRSAKQCLFIKRIESRRNCGKQRELLVSSISVTDKMHLMRIARQYFYSCEQQRQSNSNGCCFA